MEVSPASPAAGINRFIRMDTVRPCGDQLIIASWNVQGLSDIKLWEIIGIMKRRHISILCMQETHIRNTPYYTEDGFLVILSGSSSTPREFAGVGFVVAPWVKESLVGFMQFSNRLSCMKVRVPHGQIALINAYAPHAGYPFDARQSFFEELRHMVRKTSVNGMKLVMGDLNARIHRRLPGEDDFLGDFVFGSSGANLPLGSNRELLLELCASDSLCVSNTFFDHSAENQVTFRNAGIPPMQHVTPTDFATLDLCLVPQSQLHDVLNVYSCRAEPLASQHFLVVSEINCNIPVVTKVRRRRLDFKPLVEDAVAKDFAKHFSENLPDICALNADVNDISATIGSAFDKAAASILREVPASKRKPWIGEATLAFIDRRRQARAVNDYSEEDRLHKLIRKSAKSDRRRWLQEVAGSGSWSSLRRLRKGAPHKQGRLESLGGEAVDSSQRADTFAQYLQDVQWAVRPANLVDPAVFGTLPVYLGAITLKELRDAVVGMKSGKATGPDNHPVEFWKAVVLQPGEGGLHGRNWLLDLCNRTWQMHAVPEAWHLQQVALIYKKGDPAQCGNYRPICLLNAAYKIFAMVLLKRLLAAGADDRLWGSQFGFRRFRSTEDALHCIRRAIEGAWAHQGGKLHALALDWAKAFDSINTDALLNALRRFGLPSHVLSVIRSIYSNRTFQVSECGMMSSSKRQDSGICQGCPLSPFLFIIVMSLLMQDARALLSLPALAAIQSGSLSDLLYADDTLIIGESAELVTEYGEAVEKAGAMYGMTLHWGKTQGLSVCTAEQIRRPDGSFIADNGSIEYLGALLTADGRVDSEISRRIGTAAGYFRQLQKVWNHSSVTLQDKLHFFDAIVVSRLQYGLATL